MDSPSGREAEAERLAWAALATVDGLGPAGIVSLVGRFGSASAVLAAAAAGGDGFVGSEASAEAVARAGDGRTALAGRLAALDLLVLTVDDARYPPRLGMIDHPPPVLFVRGDPKALAGAHAVAIVGTRRPSDAGRALAARIAGALAGLDVVVVSGLAIGVDGAAHAGTLAADGRTVAVLGGGHGRLYPTAHDRLADRIVATGGAVVSETAPDIAPSRWSFPRRNRILSGLADATVVVEAPARSGALVTAGWALTQGRDCFLVPGRIDDPLVAGNLALLREAAGEARIVTGIPQLIEDLGLLAAGPSPGARSQAAVAALEPTAAALAAAVVDGHATVDELVAATRQPVATVLAGLARLEGRGLVVGVVGRYRPNGPLLTAGPRTRPARKRRRLPPDADRC